MKRLTLLIVILIFIQLTFSQTGTIKGYVYDSIERAPFVGANLSLINLDKNAMADFDGNFVIDSIPAGTYDLKLSWVGYRDTIIKSVRVYNDSTVNLKIIYLPPPCMYRDKNDKTCPVCKKQDKVIPIIYGLPSPGLVKEAKEGKVRLGGCQVLFNISANNLRARMILTLTLLSGSPSCSAISL